MIGSGLTLFSFRQDEGTHPSTPAAYEKRYIMCNYTQGSVISKKQPSLKSAINLALEWCSDNGMRFGMFIEDVVQYYDMDILYTDDEKLAQAIVQYIETRY